MDVLGVVIVLGRLGKAQADGAEDDEAAKHVRDGASRTGRGRRGSERSQVGRQGTTQQIQGGGDTRRSFIE